MGPDLGGRARGLANHVGPVRGLRGPGAARLHGAADVAGISAAALPGLRIDRADAHPAAVGAQSLGSPAVARVPYRGGVTALGTVLAILRSPGVIAQVSERELAALVAVVEAYGDARALRS